MHASVRSHSDAADLVPYAPRAYDKCIVYDKMEEKKDVVKINDNPVTLQFFIVTRTMDARGCVSSPSGMRAWVVFVHVAHVDV